MEPRYGDFDRSKSLQELEGEDWGEPRPEIAWSSLAQTVYKLRRVPLQDLTTENLRMLAGQNLSLEYVIPLAIEHLQEDPWYPPDSRSPVDFPGDLLHFVLMDGKSEFWNEQPELWAAMQLIIQKALALLPGMSDRERELIGRMTSGASAEWRQILNAVSEINEGQ